MKVIKRRLFFDIETSYNEDWFFTAGFKQRINYDQITKERAIICVCYKWEGQSQVHELHWKNGCDKTLLKEFIKVAETADELIGHNGDRFDLAFIRSRCAYHRLRVTPFLTTIDTLKIARSKFKFNSNRLDYLGIFLGVGKKISTGGFSLWMNVVKGCDKSLNKMIKYCKGDVRLLERVFNVLHPFVPSRTHYGAKAGRLVSSCPECGSNKTVIHGHVTRASGIKQTQMRCRDCGRNHVIATNKLLKERKGVNINEHKRLDRRTA